MTSSSNNILQNCLNETLVVSAPVSSNMVIGSLTVPIQNELSSNISLDGFQQVENKTKKRIKRRLTTSTIKKKRSLDQTNINSKPVVPAPISITTESTRYAQTRYPFPPFIIRFNAGKVTSNKIKEGLIDHCIQNYQMEINILNCHASSFSFLLNQNNWPDSFSNENYIFPNSSAIPPQLSLLIKNVDLRLDFNEFGQEIKTRYPQIKNVIRLKNKFNNGIKLVKLELTSSSVREELLTKRKITIGYIVYDIDEYLAPANILICSQCMGLGHSMKQCTQIKNTCRTCGETADDLKLHICSQIEKCIHCGQNHKSNSFKCQV
ncbi:unnamed protein product, partial [Rotaria magnacalcarata]